MPVQSFALDFSCDPIREKRLEKANAECERKSKKATNQWKEISTARFEVLKILRQGNVSDLLPYVGCDGSISTKLDQICEKELPEIGIKELKKVSEALKKSASNTIEKGAWQTHGIEKDIFVFCSDGFRNKASKNPCDEKGIYQPVVELRKSGDEFYLFGLPEISDSSAH